MTAGAVLAPAAPGRLGQAIDLAAAAAYLEALGGWRDARKAELDELDAAALSSREGPGLTGDIALSLALWKAASDRYEQLLRVWDSGRVGPVERQRLSSLIWGRLATTGDASLLGTSSAPRPEQRGGSLATGLNVSLPEACRLSDALAGQLRARLGLELAGLEVTARLRDLRAQLERIRDQVNLEPAGARQQRAAEQQSRLARRLQDVIGKAERGGDVGGLLGPLEIDAATFERDLIVDGAQRRTAGTKVRLARRQRSELEGREEALRSLAAECVSTVDPAPRLAVPDVEALGPVPNTLPALESYLQRLALVDRAMRVAEQAYRDALDRHAELVSRLAGYRAKAVAIGADGHPDVARAYDLAADALSRRPAQLAIAEQLVTLYQTYLRSAPAFRRSS
jgi:hypothetical protein